MKKIGIFRTVFPLSSETFIEQQVRSMSGFNAVLLNRSALGPTDINQLAISKLPFGALRAKLFSLTASPVFFGESIFKEKISLIHAHFGPDATYALPLARLLDVPTVVTFHGFDCTIRKKELLLSGRYSDWRFLCLENRLKKQAARFIAVSKFIESTLLERGYPREKVVQHYIGVDTKKFHPINEKLTVPYILCVGRHTKVKGIDTLLYAFSRVSRRHPNVMLVQVGEGSMTAELKQLAQTLGIAERVHFLGAKSSAEVLQLMQSCSLFVLPSQIADNGQREALGIVFNEASACGIPIVSTRHGGIPEAVLHGETGILVSEKNDAELADAIDHILCDPRLGEELGRCGREYVCDVFDIEKQTKKLELIYQDVIYEKKHTHT